MTDRRRIAVIGLGYVGLPVAVAFARAGFETLGFDTDARRVAELREGIDRTREVRGDLLVGSGLRISSDLERLRRSDFYIVAVPTPIDAAKSPDLSMLLAASRAVGSVLSAGNIVVYESTVYPGATEEVCLPVLSEVSGLHAGVDFTVGYSPERINPGDPQHRFETITKVVSGQDARTLEIVAQTYSAVVTAGVHRAPSIRTAEAAKVIENTQRDLNIALMNELSLIFSRMDLDTGDVLAAAGTKWNFLRFTPGLVGGHCIGVDPYYLTHKAQALGCQPEVILAGRRTNDALPARIAQECVRRLLRRGAASPWVTVLGVTFKADVPDVRNSKAAAIAQALADYGIEVQVADPLADPQDTAREYGLTLTPMDELRPAHAVILAAPHAELVASGWAGVRRLLDDGEGVVMDVKGVLDRAQTPPGVDLWRL